MIQSRTESNKCSNLNNNKIVKKFQIFHLVKLILKLEVFLKLNKDKLRNNQRKNNNKNLLNKYFAISL